MKQQRRSADMAALGADRNVQVDLAALRDEELLGLIVQRQSTALGTLYDRYGRLVFTVALRITGDRETAEEVTQDVFQNVWQSAGGFQASSGSSTAWLMGITRHRAIDATRSRRYRARTREENLDFDHPSTEESGPEHQTDMLLLRETVQGALRELPLAQRQAIELAYYGGLTRAEIAERLGEPLGTVKTRMRLGMLKLRALFLQQDIEVEREA